MPLSVTIQQINGSQNFNANIPRNVNIFVSGNANVPYTQVNGEIETSVATYQHNTSAGPGNQYTLTWNLNTIHEAGPARLTVWLSNNSAVSHTLIIQLV